MYLMEESERKREKKGIIEGKNVQNHLFLFQWKKDYFQRLLNLEGVEIRGSSPLIIILKIHAYMIPTQSNSFQPYFVFQAFPESFQQYFPENTFPFVFSNFVPQNNVSVPIVNGLGIQRREPISIVDQKGVSKQKKRQNPPTDQHQNLDAIRKEKLIRKLANRPPTYLTQKRYYMSQILPEESHQGRQLRTRHKKKKIHSTIKPQTKHEQAYTVSSSKEIPLSSQNCDKEPSQKKAPEVVVLYASPNVIDDKAKSPQQKPQMESNSQSLEFVIQTIAK